MAPRRHPQRGRLASRYDNSGLSGESSADDNAPVAVVGQTQKRKRVCPDRSISVFSSSSLSSVDETVSPLLSPQRHHGRQREQKPLHDSPQGKGADPGSLVWIRVTRSGKLAPGERDSLESYWWPACVTKGHLTAGPVTVSLFGEISSAAPRSIQLEAPSPSHILPFKWPGQDVIRFSSATFRCFGTSPQRETSSKRPKTALYEAWRFAVDLAHEADATLNDGLPSNLSSYRVGATPIHERKAEKSIGRADASTNSPKIPSGLTVRWSPPPCDPLLEIPGELVFSLERRGKTEYWAARVEGYLPPRTPSMPPKYRVRFKDDTFRTVSRDMFYTSDEPEFYTCKLGRYMSDEEEIDTDSDDEYVSWETVIAKHEMPPPNPEDFCELSIREQFAYVKPVIKAILNETYLPVRDRHQAFMQGGPSRLRLRKAAMGKGNLTAHEVSQLGRVLQCWVLGPMHSQKGNFPLLEDLESESGVSTDFQVEQMLCPDSPAAPNSIRFRSRPEYGLTGSQSSECRTSLSSHSPPVSLPTPTDVSQVTVINSRIQIPPSITRSGHPDLCGRWDPRATKRFLRATSYSTASSCFSTKLLFSSYYGGLGSDDHQTCFHQTMKSDCG
ncbi:hypothetical protein BJV78DRAFT_292061 [Lactifluus subvellereus]|nr:hypothetical protein BJV78DRAFT_292061 [Lactifluus subvellereus]